MEATIKHSEIDLLSNSCFVVFGKKVEPVFRCHILETTTV
jgi:hypothetical protein